MNKIDFYLKEKLYRAVLPYEPFIKEDGTISSAAFKDSQGLSVDRQMHRENKELSRLQLITVIRNLLDIFIYLQKKMIIILNCIKIPKKSID